jgi:preprotein translocase subunit SecA
MDYLKEGIHLRAMGQKDPLTEWQREGFEMFGAMMETVAREFVKYVMHVQVKIEEEPTQPAAADSAATDVEYSGPSDPSESGGIRDAAVAGAIGDQAPARVEESQPASNTPLVKSDMEKTPRNAPCPCGSGRKFKQCHGR